jgi:hypothetical protein
VNQTLPIKSVCDSPFNVPGWNDFVQEKYDSPRDAFLDWVYWCRPRSGPIFPLMSRSKAAFKPALRYCRKHDEQLRADACAKSLDLHDSKGFWNRVKKGNCDEAIKFANCV